MKRGSYDASIYDDEKIKREITRLLQGVNADEENMNTCLKCMDFHGAKTLLDLGCGPGGTSIMIAKYNPDGKIIGIDREERFISFAKKNAEHLKIDNVDFIIGDCLNLPFEENQFDCCFSRFVFQHLSNPMAALKEMIRVTKPGGVIGIYEWDEGLTCFYPEPKHYQKYVKAEMTRRRFTKGDIFLGRKLYSMFYNSGLNNIKVFQLYSNIVSPGRDVLLDGQQWSEKPSEQHPYVKSGLMTISELEEYYKDLELIITSKDTYVSFGSFFVAGEIQK